MEIAAFRIASGFYALAAGLAFAYLFLREERLSLWMWRLLGLGLALHLLSFGLRIHAFWAMPENRYYLPAHTFFGFISWVALTTALIFFVVEGVKRLHILGAFVLPWTLLAAAAALLADPAVGSLKPELRSYNLHPLAVMLAYSGFANALGVGLALLVQNHQVKSRRPSELCFRLPSIEELDRLHSRIVYLSFLVLTVGILMGVSWAHQAWQRRWSLDPKVLWAALTWAIYGGLLLLRRFGGLRGRKSVYVSILGFISVLVTFAAVSYISRQHGYLTGS